jgi:hypothetical protein
VAPACRSAQPALTAITSAAIVFIVAVATSSGLCTI